MTEPGAGRIAPPARRRGRRARSALWFLAALFALIGLTFVQRVPLAEWAASRWLARQLGAPARVDIAEIGWTQALIRHLGLGAGEQVKAEDIRIGFDLLGARIERVSVARLTIAASYRQRFSLDDLDPAIVRLMQPGAAAGTGRGVPALAIERFDLILASPLGPITGGGSAAFDGKIATFAFALAEGGDHARIAADFSLPWEARAFVPAGKFSLRIDHRSSLWRGFGLPQPKAGSISAEAALQPNAAGGDFLARADWAFGLDAMEWPDVPAPVNARLAGTADLAPQRVSLSAVTGDLGGGLAKDLALHLSGEAGMAMQAPFALTAQFAVKAEAKSLALGQTRLTKPRLDLDLALAGDATALELSLTRAGTIGFAKAEQAGLGRVASGAPIEILAAAEPLARVALAQGIALGNAPEVRYALGLGKMSLDADIAGVPDRLRVALPGLALSGGAIAGGNAALAATLRDGALKVPTMGLEFSGVSLDLEASADGIALRLDKAGFAGPGGMAPLTLSGTARIAGGSLDLSAKAQGATLPVAISLAGKFDLAKDSGRADIDLAPLDFAPGALQPDDIFPPLASVMEEMSGRVSLTGPIFRDKGQWRAALKLGLRGLSGKMGPVRLTNLNSVVEIERPWPLTTRPDQELAVELADIGLPLTNALFHFRFRDGEVLDLGQSHLELAGGAVRLAPTSLALKSAAQNLKLTVDGVSVGQLFQAIGIAGLTGEGSISGEVPVTLFPGGIAIPGAALKANAPGVLKYDKTQAPLALQGASASVDMALQALSDFHYDRLSLDLSRSLAGEVKLGLHIAGRNPNFYEGYPVEFNLTIEGRLDEVVRRGLAGYHVPDMIEERLLELHP